MYQFLIALGVTLGCFTAAQAITTVPPLLAGKKADSRQKIVDQVQTDLDQVRDRLNADDAGAEMRDGQKRVLKGIDDLLKQKDPNQPQSPPPPSNPPPTGTIPPKPTVREPAPMPTPALPKQQPAESAKVTPPEASANIGKESAMDGPWPPFPPRHRPALDAVGRDRFVPAYQEVLREYYRNLAQNSRENND